MLTLSHYSLVAGVVLTTLALASYILALTAPRSVSRRPALAHAGAGHGGAGHGADGSGAAPRRNTSHGSGLARYGTVAAQLGFAFLTAALVCRAIGTGHGPFANQYEFAVAFAWGMVGGYVVVERRYHVRTLALLILPVAATLLLYALSIGGDAAPLVPALQNNLLLTVHVAVAIGAYGAFAVACAAGALYLLQPEGGRHWLPRPALLDEVAYRAVVVAFPLMTMTIVLGAVWADIAWGSYWSWDPKETASLLTWLIYGAYLHARVVRGWRGRRAAWLLMAGFAAVLFTFFGNLFFGGLHSYAGVTQ